MAKKTQQPVLISGTANAPLSKKIAKELGLSLAKVDIVQFADKETHVVLQEDMKGRDVYIIQPTSNPANETIMELLLIAHAVQDMKPKRITAIMPFFGYRRQEKKTHPGEVLSFRLVAKLMKAAGITRVGVMDLHKRRSAQYFKDAGIVCHELRAFDMISTYFKQKRQLKDFVLVAPDKGSVPVAERYAKELGVPVVKAQKHRTMDKRDQVTYDSLGEGVKGKNVLIIDDEINTAGTLMGVADLLKKQKAKNVYFACTHGVLSNPAKTRLAKSRIRQVVITDTIFLPSQKRLPKIKVLSVAPMFAGLISKWSGLK